jgi:hypothetical protein
MSLRLPEPHAGLPAQCATAHCRSVPRPSSIPAPVGQGYGDHPCQSRLTGADHGQR